MRAATPRETLIQSVCALLLLVSLLAAFSGSGGFEDAYGAWQPGNNAAFEARLESLAAAFGRSLLIGVLTASMALGIGIPAGWALARRTRPLWLLLFAALPLALPASVAVSGWFKLCAPGAASSFAMPFQIATRGVSWVLFSPIGAAVVLGCGLWPIVAFETWPAFRRARNEAYDAAILCGARSFWNGPFFRIVLPQAKGELAAGALLVFLLGCGDFSVGSLLLQRTLTIEIHDALMSGKTAGAAWASLPLIAMAFIAALLLSRMHSKYAGAGLSGDIRSEATGSKFELPFAALTIGVFLGFALPMLACVYGALNGTQPMSHVFSAGSDAVSVTVRLAGSAALLSLLVAILRLMAWPETRARPINAMGLFLLTIPGSFLAAALLTVQTDFLPHNSERMAAVLPVAMLAAGYVLRFIYIPLRLMEEGLAGLDPDLLAAAALSGHGRISRAITIAMPLVLPHLAAAGALVFILSIGEVPIADRLHSPGVTPAAIWLFQQQHLGYDESVFGLSLLLGTLTVAVLGGVGLVSAFCETRLRQLRGC